MHIIVLELWRASAVAAELVFFSDLYAYLS